MASDGDSRPNAFNPILMFQVRKPWSLPSRAFFKKLQLLGLSLNEGLFPTQLRVYKGHAVQTFIRWNVESVRGYQKAGRCSFFNMDEFLLMIKRAQLI
jgi:hypothetical protein